MSTVTNTEYGWEKRKCDRWLPVLLLVIALASRAYDLGTGPFQVDEYYTVYSAAERAQTLLNPASNALALVSFKLFGISEWSARLPAMILGTLSIPLFFLAWRQLLGRHAALIGALITLFSSWHLWHSQFSRYYAGVFFFGVLSYYLFHEALRRDDLRWLIAAGLSMTIGVLFHATSALVVVTCAVFALLVTVSEQLGRAGYSRRVARVFTVICSVGLAPALVVGWWIMVVWRTVGQSAYGPAGVVLQIAKYVQFPISTAAAIGLILLLRRNRATGLFFLLAIGVPTTALVFGSGFMSVRRTTSSTRFLWFSAWLVTPAPW